MGFVSVTEHHGSASNQVLRETLADTTHRALVPRQGRNFLKWRIHPIADKLGIPRKLVTFQVMRRTLGTDLQGHGTMKDAQQILRHASIKTTAEIYMQEIQASVRSAINSRTREIFSQRSEDLRQLENPV